MKKLGRNLSVKNEKTAYVIAVAIALIIASSLFVVYLVALKPAPDRYTTIYLLDSNEKAADYPETLVVGVNSTFSVNVGVENHIGSMLDATILVKITSDENSAFPLNVAPVQEFTNSTIADNGKWIQPVTVTLDNSGKYLVAFELWTTNSTMTYSGQLVALNIQVIAPQ
jgi:uncharacterized membrane protein